MLVASFETSILKVAVESVGFEVARTIDVDDSRSFVKAVDVIILFNDTGNCELGARVSSSTVVVLTTSITEICRQIIGYTGVPRYLQSIFRWRYLGYHKASLITILAIDIVSNKDRWSVP